MSLQDKHIVITRSERGAREWKTLLEAEGATVYHFPTITMSPVSPTPELEDTLRSMNGYDWLVFTSAAGVRYLKELAQELDVSIDISRLPPVATVSDRTGAAVRRAGFNVQFQPTRPDSLHLGAELTPVKGKKVLLLRTTIASGNLAEQLASRGTIVTDVPIYQTSLLRNTDPALPQLLDADEIDYITFASPSALRGFCLSLDKAHLSASKKLPVVAIGRGVAEALEAAGFTDVHVAKEPNAESVVQILRQLSQ